MARLEAIDFPSDPYNYTGALRKELTLLFGRALYSQECLDAIKATLEFYGKKLPEAEKFLKAHLKAEAEKAAAEHAANEEIEKQERPKEDAPAPQGEIKARVTTANPNAKK